MKDTGDVGLLSEEALDSVVALCHLVADEADVSEGNWVTGRASLARRILALLGKE